MSSVYEEHKDSDGFLCACFPARLALAHCAYVFYSPDITYSGENTFGAVVAGTVML